MSGSQSRSTLAWIARVAVLVILIGGLFESMRRTGTLPGQKIGGTVTVLGVWSGSELESFLAMVKPFEARTGVKVQLEGIQENGVLTARIQGGAPPDVAVLSAPVQMTEFARAGKLVPLDSVLDMNALRNQYGQSWLDLASVDGKVYGIFVKVALKGLIWYNPKALAAAGYTVPTTWDEMLALTDRLATEGKTPWCIGLESSAASGWPATDWIEDIVLRTAGANAYDKWSRHEIAWTDPIVRRAWELFGQIATNSKYVYGSRYGALITNFKESAFPLFTTPPGCFLHHQATFIQDFLQQQYPGFKPGEDFDFFAFPAIDPDVPKAAEIAADLFGMFRDTPQTRALIQYLTTPSAQSIWVKRGGTLSPNRWVRSEDYPDPLARRAAQILTSADVVRFDANDLMPEAVNAAFWKGALDYVQSPARLDAILQNLERVSLEVYGK